MFCIVVGLKIITQLISLFENLFVGVNLFKLDYYLFLLFNIKLIILFIITCLNTV